MTPPDDTPPKWLQPNSYRPGYLRMTDEVIDLCETQDNDGDRPLPEWLAWRSRVATALGLVDPSKNRTGVCPSAAIDVAVAAELRRLADAFDNCEDRFPGYQWPEKLRARADELGPK